MAIKQKKRADITDRLTLRMERLGLDIGIPLGSGTLF